jgi:hypothetical protein
MVDSVLSTLPTSTWGHLKCMSLYCIKSISTENTAFGTEGILTQRVVV